MSRIFQIFRIENEEGTGPYIGNDPYNPTLKNMFNEHAESACHANVLEDEMLADNILAYFGGIEDFDAWDAWCLSFSGSFRYGFISIEHLEQWFVGYFDVLQDAGYKIVEYVVEEEHVAFGQNQVVFNSEFASETRTIDIEDALEYVGT